MYITYISLEQRCLHYEFENQNSLIFFIIIVYGL